VLMQNVVNTLKGSFTPLQLPNFRIYLGGQAVSLIGTWLQLTAQGWVVWELSQSNRALGIVAMLGSLPILLLGPWAGVWADRLDRRRLLIITQAVAMVLAFILALLVQTDAIRLWHVYILSTLLGVVTALDLPAQQAFLGDLSGMAQVRKAVILNAMIIQVSRILGPALAGFIIGAIGVAPAFWLNGLSFAAVIASLVAVRANQVRKDTVGRPLQEFREGLAFILATPRIQDLILFAFLITFFGLPILNILPSVVTTVLGGDAQALGLLLSASGVGALVGTLIVVPLVQPIRRTGVVIGLAVIWTGSWFFFFSFSTWLPLSMLFLFMVSMTVPVVLATANGLLQTLAPPTMRARLLSTYLTVIFGIQPVASLFVGYSADLLGPPRAMRINGLLMAAGGLLMLLARPELRRWQVHFQDSPQPEHQPAAPNMIEI
jgi:MFS family permease